MCCVQQTAKLALWALSQHQLGPGLVMQHLKYFLECLVPFLAPACERSRQIF